MTLEEYFRIGVTVTLGSHRFEPEAIKAFARKYDPQAYHLDEEAAQKSALGGLCASAWHTTATWMKYNLASREGPEWTGPGPKPQLGPSPGFRNLRLPKPVYAGETITFTRKAVGLRPNTSRPGWMILAMEAGATDSTGATVMEFESAVLVKVE